MQRCPSPTKCETPLSRTQRPWGSSLWQHLSGVLTCWAREERDSLANRLNPHNRWTPQSPKGWSTNAAGDESSSCPPSPSSPPKNPRTSPGWDERLTTAARMCKGHTEKRARAGTAVADAHGFHFLMLKLTASLSRFTSHAMMPCALPLNVFQCGASYSTLLLSSSQILYLHTPNPHSIGLETACWSLFSYIRHACVSKRQHGPS